MSVRARFKIDSVMYRADDAVISMTPVAVGAENKTFYAKNPVGNISLQSISAATAQQFTPGKEYFLDFTEVPPTIPTPAVVPPVAPSPAVPPVTPTT